MKEWSKNLNVLLPECNKCGGCCCCASPSVSYKKLLEKASLGEEFARDFLSIFVPYNKIEEAKKIFPDIVQKTLVSIQKGNNSIEPEELVFYKCRYYSEEKKCLIYEDRPLLCRDFPGSPYVILSERCAFYEWAQVCKQKYKELKNELDTLKQIQSELKNFKYQQKSIYLSKKIKTVSDEDKFLWLCPSLSIISPGNSWIKL